MQIVVLGYIVRGPYGGLVWHHLQYILGLMKLGYRVLFLEDSDDYPSCSSPATPELTTDASYGLRFIRKIFDHFVLKNNWAYYDAHTNIWYGLSKEKVFSFCAHADLLLNISGVNPLRAWWQKIPLRILIDTDPAFTQIRHLAKKREHEIAQHHTHFFTYGENFGKKACTIPDDGFNWKPTRQPVFLEAWKINDDIVSNKWTTVMQWDSYNQGLYNGQVFGMKSLSFNQFERIPQLLPHESFELALGNCESSSLKLQSKGWQVVNSLTPTKTPWDYQQYIANSKGEWSIAKHGYVVSNSGWFSERSLCYMASGKPVLLQDTGYSSFIDVGRGLLSFRNVEDVTRCVQEVNSNYKKHCLWSRELVENHFSSSYVLKDLIDRIQ